MKETVFYARAIALLEDISTRLDRMEAALGVSNETPGTPAASSEKPAEEAVTAPIKVNRTKKGAGK